MRCVLIPPAGGGSWEMLPQGALPLDVFGPSPLITSDTAVLEGVGAVELMWQHNQLNSQPNPVASSLARGTVCGDCVAVLRGDLEAEGGRLRAALDAVVARCASPAPCQSPSTPGAQRQRRARGERHPIRAEAVQCPVKAAPAAPGSGGGGADACEPRQQLLWMLAGRATSLSWDRPTSPVALSGGADLIPGGQAAPAEVKDEEPTSGNYVPADAPDCSGAVASPWGNLSPELMGQIVGAAGENVVVCPYRQHTTCERGITSCLWVQASAFRWCAP
jgi:hypothetical protein